MIFTMYNQKTNVFKSLFEAETHDDAIKGLLGVFDTTQPSELKSYPDEYILMELGDFDKSTGLISVNAAPISVINGLQLFKMWKDRRNYLENLYKEEKNESRVETSDVSEIA